MGKNEQAGTPTGVIDAVLDGQEEIPEWAVASPTDQQVAVYTDHYQAQYRRPLQPNELLAYVAGQINSYEDDDPRIAMEIAAQVVAATTVDEVLGGVDTTKGKEILDTIIEVNALKFVMSSEPGGCPYFALISARDTSTNEHHTISVGGWRLVLQLGQIHYLTSPLDPSSPYLVAKDAVGALAPESFPVYFRIKQKPTSTPGKKVNYLARTTDI